MVDLVIEFETQGDSNSAVFTFNQDNFEMNRADFMVVQYLCHQMIGLMMMMYIRLKFMVQMVQYNKIYM